MITEISEHEAKRLRDQLFATAKRFDIFVEFDQYEDWIIKIFEFISSRHKKIRFGIEKYRGDLAFFNVDSNEIYAVMFMSKYVPVELVFFGIDWMIGISSYPEVEGASGLEYALRLYGTAGVLGNTVTV